MAQSSDLVLNVAVRVGRAKRPADRGCVVESDCIGLVLDMLTELCRALSVVDVRTANGGADMVVVEIRLCVLEIVRVAVAVLSRSEEVTDRRNLGTIGSIEDGHAIDAHPLLPLSAALVTIACTVALADEHRAVAFVAFT